MDLMCHENLASTIDLDHHRLHHQHHHHHTTKATAPAPASKSLCHQHDDYMSSNSSSSSFSYSLSPPATYLSQYSIASSGIGSLAGTEDSNFSDLTRSSSHCSLSGGLDSSSSTTFANFRRQYSPEVGEEVVVVVQDGDLQDHEEIVETSTDHHHVEQQQTVRSHVVSQSGATKRPSSAQVIHYNHSPKIRKADRDPVFLENRCLANLFELEAQLYLATRGQMKGEINEQMRRIVAGWMMEVSV